MFFRIFLIASSLFVSSHLYAATPTPTPTPTSTRSVAFKWNASTTSTVKGYKICWGTGPGNYQNTRDVGKVLTSSLTLSKSTQYYVAVAAYDSSRTSSFSNEVVVAPSW